MFAAARLAAARVAGARLFGTAILVLATLGSTARSSMAEGVVHSEVDARRIGLEDQVQLTITVEGSALPDQVALPALTNLALVGGPSVSTQMSFVNGQMSQARSWIYVLKPLAVGHAEVGAAKVRFDSGEARAPAIPIEVAAGSVKPTPAPRRPIDVFDEDPFADLFGSGRAVEPRLLVEAKPSRVSLFVGEPLVLTYYLYTQTSVSGLQFAEAPQYAGFWAEDLERSGRPNGDPATIEGMAYRRFPVLTKLLFPTRAGRITIPAAALSIGIPRQTLFGGGGVVRRSTKPVTIEVKAIPDQPGFNGAVGRFRAGAAVDRPTLALGEAATLRFKVEGSGNLKWVDRGPEVSVPGAKVYPPQVKSDLKASVGGIVGSRTWEYVIVPQTAGTLEVPALAFTYFDPSKQRIERSETAALPLSVQGGAAGVAPAVPLAGSGPIPSGGPLPLRTELESRSFGGSPWSGGAVGLMAGMILLLHGALWGSGQLGRLRLRRAGPTAAPRSVRGALRDLERIGRHGMTKEAAAGLIEKTIHGVFGSLDGVEDERARAVRKLLDEVHSVRYAPQLGDYSEKLRELAGRAGEVVRRWV
jgi:hypothetical protein